MIPHWLGQVLHVPHSVGSDESELRRRSVVQFSAIIGVGSMLLYAGLHAFVDWQVLQPPALLSLACIPVYLLVFWLNRSGRAEAAKVLFCLLLSGSMFVSTYFLVGKAPGMHFFFLLAAVIPLLLWDLRKVVPVAFFMALSLVGFLVVQLRENEPSLLVPVFPSSWVLFYNAMSVVAVYSTVVVILVFFVRQANRSAERFELLSRTDALTELLNRRAILTFLQEETSRMNRNQTAFSVLMLDLDYFKDINDNHGHAAGDFVLTEVAQLLRRSMREIDRVARWGGEEFLVLLPDTSTEGAYVVAEKIRTAIASHAFRYGNAELHVSVTIGVASHNRVSEDSEASIRRADRALYRGKEAGRNQVVLDAS